MRRRRTQTPDVVRQTQPDGARSQPPSRSTSAMGALITPTPGHVRPRERLSDSKSSHTSSAPFTSSTNAQLAMHSNGKADPADAAAARVPGAAAKHSTGGGPGKTTSAAAAHDRDRLASVAEGKLSSSVIAAGMGRAGRRYDENEDDKVSTCSSPMKSTYANVRSTSSRVPRPAKPRSMGSRSKRSRSTTRLRDEYDRKNAQTPPLHRFPSRETQRSNGIKGDGVINSAKLFFRSFSRTFSFKKRKSSKLYAVEFGDEFEQTYDSRAAEKLHSSSTSPKKEASDSQFNRGRLIDHRLLHDFADAMGRSFTACHVPRTGTRQSLRVSQSLEERDTCDMSNSNLVANGLGVGVGVPSKPAVRKLHSEDHSCEYFDSAADRAFPKGATDWRVPCAEKEVVLQKHSDEPLGKSFTEFSFLFFILFFAY